MSEVDAILHDVAQRMIRDMLTGVMHESGHVRMAEPGCGLRCEICGKLNHVGLQHECRLTGPIRVQATVGRPMLAIEDAEVIEDDAA